MDKLDLIKLKGKIASLQAKEKEMRILHQRKFSTGEILGPPTGYPSIDMPWLKWYPEEFLTFSVPKMSIFQCVYESNKNHLNDIALEYYGKNITYNEMFKKIDKLAKAFKQNGIKKGEIVTVGMLTTPEAIYTMLALNKIGAIASMIDPRSNVIGLRQYLLENGSDVLIITDLFKGKFKKALEGTKTKKVITSSVLDSVENFPLNSDNLQRFQKIFKCKKKDFTDKTFVKMHDYVRASEDFLGELQSEYREGQPSLIVHSGGTTGFPKAVVMTDYKVLASVFQGINSGIKFERGESWLGIMPLFIIYGASTGTLLPLIKGIKINLIPLFSPKKLPNYLKKKKPIHMTLAPSHFEYLINSKKLENEDLSYIVAPTVGGDSMNVDLELKSNNWLKEHNCVYSVLKGYGSSETCSGVTINVSNDCNIPGSVGIPLPLTSISIFEVNSDEEKQFNQLGEICVKGPTAMLEYLNSKSDTELVIREHSDGEKWIHTGDLGYINEDGMLFVTDRIKRLIVNYGGFKILPSYVEKIVLEVPNIEKCVVVGIKDENHSQGEVPVACVVLKNNVQKESTETIEEVKLYCRKKIKDAHQVPVEIYELNDLPYIKTNGKVDTKKVKEIVYELKLQEKRGKLRLKKKK